jgi:serine/threonine protein kinase
MWGHEQLIGTVIDGKYRLDRIIGNGGMGAVFGGIHLQLGRQVAVKILRADYSSDTIAHARFVREARASARIEHPNAVHVYDFGSIPEVGSFLVMEFADGVSLRQMINERGRLPLDLALDLLRQTAAALEAAHANGVVHRDVKPENLMVCVDADGRRVVKVVDFGIAKLVSSDGATQLTSPQDLIGTPRYMAPEIFTGEEVDGRVDVYALGIVLFEMLTGRAPFDGTFSEVIGKHIYTPPPTLEEFGAEYGDEIEAVLQRALAKSPADRFQAPLDLASAFAEACGPEIAAAVPPPLPFVIHTPPSDWRFDTGEELATLANVPAVDVTPSFATKLVGSSAPAAALPRVSRIDVPLSDSFTTLARAKETLRGFVAPAFGRRWSAAPAALAIAAVLSFGVLNARSEDGSRPALEGAARARVSGVLYNAAPAPANSTVLADREPKQERAAGAPRKRLKASRARRIDEPRRDSAGRRIGGFFRVDRHVRRVF